MTYSLPPCLPCRFVGPSTETESASVEFLPKDASYLHSRILFPKPVFMYPGKRRGVESLNEFA